MRRNYPCWVRTKGRRRSRWCRWSPCSPASGKARERPQPPLALVPVVVTACFGEVKNEKAPREGTKNDKVLLPLDPWAVVGVLASSSKNANMFPTLTASAAGHRPCPANHRSRRRHLLVRERGQEEASPPGAAQRVEKATAECACFMRSSARWWHDVASGLSCSLQALAVPADHLILATVEDRHAAPAPAASIPFHPAAVGPQ
ncbi:hypothetical protein OsJ_02097 [Oryza sativa Japonica Group]|uniref:Uncharacterized protein n=1 Tax=Oryza sativa subsp. japonica TaxID=39947 RepID=B9EXC8_ORYSJ|nr:hypothetical protein OsJ_02097 [Oryza sativa Japonica Group]